MREAAVLKRCAESVVEIIGGTPMVHLARMKQPGEGDVFAKLEFLNPGGSIKDRAALGMIEQAEKDGRLKPGSTIIEPTAGNTGIGLALVGVSRGYRVILVVPSKCSREKLELMEALGGEVVITPAAKGMAAALDRAYELAREIHGSFIPQQFENPANPGIHYETTGAEIFQQMEGRLDAIAIGAGTGGTFTGIARYLKERLPKVKAWVVEPVGSVYTGAAFAPYEIEGIGSSWIPANLDLGIAEGVISVHDADAFEMSRKLARMEGILAAGSSGAAAVAAFRLARELGEGSRVATLFPDSGERYLSKALYGGKR